MAKKVIEVKNLKTYFFTEMGTVKAVDGVDFHVNEGETLGIVGESGCGKSVSSMSILRLIPNPPGKIVEGEIFFNDVNLLDLSISDMRKIRGNDIAMIFQEPMTSLNPVFTIEKQIAEVLMMHRGMSKEEARIEIIRLLDIVGIPRSDEVIKDYPFALSGGMKQRAMIAMALACNPKLLIADEPTTALDVTIQAQVLELMKKLQRDFNTSIMFITHDLSVISEMADRVIVMYSGRVVEEASVYDIFEKPLHPYTEGLLNSKPDLNLGTEKLHVIPGAVPNPLDRPDGCQFAPRCEYAIDICREKEPTLVQIEPARKVRCWLRDGSVT
ncbi:MAG: peptide ABC transporter ATP-binding protein [Alkaliphilus sp.]|nr:MAG: peptide ABC transporter ATP-binding protein [Alkaliphilus sp.]